MTLELPEHAIKRRLYWSAKRTRAASNDQCAAIHAPDAGNYIPQIDSTGTGGANTVAICISVSPVRCTKAVKQSSFLTS